MLIGLSYRGLGWEQGKGVQMGRFEGGRNGGGGGGGVKKVEEDQRWKKGKMRMVVVGKRDKRNRSNRDRARKNYPWSDGVKGGWEL